MNGNNDLSFVAAGASDSLKATFEENHEEALRDPDFAGPASLDQGFEKAGFTILVDPTHYDIPFPQLEVITTRAFLKTQPDLATRYLRAIIEGIHMVKNNPEPSIRAMGKYLRINDREALEEVYRLYREIYPQIPYPSSAAIQTQLT
jgi:ABC-type nitrate/sulfonate/bicarbonate transport system substrate-binding protein